tara:strand:- start:10217 stop:19900 length:9684 start_codon:yes stop_codon:yes gene_type:complete
MDKKTGTQSTAPAPALGWLIAPLAVLLALAAIQLVGIEDGLNTENLAPMFIVGIAGLLGLAPMVLTRSSPNSLSPTTLSLSTLVFALIGSQIITGLDYSAFTALQFAVVMFGVHFMSSRGRYEFATILVFATMGINVGIVAATEALGTLPNIINVAADGEQVSYASTINLRNQAVGYVFFSYVVIFLLIGTLLATFARGRITPASESGWFSFLNDQKGSLMNKHNLPLQAALFVWIFAQSASLWHFGQVSEADQLGVSVIEGYHGYFGFWPALFTGMVSLIVAGMFAERWHTRAMTLGSMWMLYLVSTWYDAGLFTSSMLEGNWGSLIWVGVTFFLGVGIYSISTHDRWGGWSNRDDHEYSGARLFWNQHWAGIMIGLAFMFGLIIRMQWYIVPSMNSTGTGEWDMTGGSDPWYMKRVVDYILANNAHMIYDADRYYPIGGINPRPPLFTWSIAILATLLGPFFDNGDAVWWAILSLPAIYGALTIYPVALIAKEHINEKAAVVAAWLIAFMPAHVSHTTWGLADHDAFIMLFISLGFLFWLRAVKYAGSERLLKQSSPSLRSFLASFSAVVQQRQAAMAAAVLAGVSFGVVSLGWKGFVVGPSILFLAYAAQVALNMFRRRDSTTLNVLFLTMLSVNLMMALPWFAHPQIDLVLDGTGLQPFLFIFFFTIAISFVTTGFRDKPWLLILGVLAGAGLLFFTVLWLLKQANLSNAWDVLFTGSGYFTKTKIFGTVAEANAPPRGRMFAEFGPITFLLSLIMGVLCLWSALRERKQIKLVFGVWIITASFMAWTAARFSFNATPAIAVLGAWGIVSLWKWANWDGLVRTWKKLGVRAPEDRIRGARIAVWRTPSFSAILLIMVMLFGQQATYGLDAAMPRSNDESNLDETIYNIIPDIMRWEIGGFSLLDDAAYAGNSYLGYFGSTFESQGWNYAHQWLSEQDVLHDGITDQASCIDVDGIWDAATAACLMQYSDKPAFVSWWDYGFAALESGEHPSVSDNFQSGIPATGNMLLARTQEDLTSMFIWQLAQGDISYMAEKTGTEQFTNGFSGVVDNFLVESSQMELFNDITMNTNNEQMIDLIEASSYAVIETNSDVVMAVGHHQVDGIYDDSTPYWRIYKGGEPIVCTDSLSASCVDGEWSEKSEADRTFTNNIRSGQDTTLDTTHYIIGDYWYTADLVDEYDSVATNIHRKNARLALTVQLFDNALTSDEIFDMYHELMQLEIYSVQNYDGAPGDMIDRNHEIRYFAVDNRLYPKAGRNTADYNYNSGQPTGIFGAPTILSGQDMATYMTEVYETTRGEFQDEMTREEVDAAITQDYLNQQSGADVEPLQVQDIRVDHNPEFFDTMLARNYVGYGASTLGIDSGSSNPQPSSTLRWIAGQAQYAGDYGSPGSVLARAPALPGAMTNHFVIANWYSAEANSSVTMQEQQANLWNANTDVKILKYYSGAEISGQVTMSDNGEGLPNVRLLIERDAFSGEDSEDLDPDTYWIPIGMVDSDENGHWSFDAPAGSIRVSAFAGVYDPTVAQDSLRSNGQTQGYIEQILGDILSPTNEDRQINDITAILGEVANMSWLGETQYNVSGAQADRLEPVTSTFDIAVQSSGVSGLVTWSGDESFDGDALISTDFILRNIWSMTENYTLTTTNGSFTSTDSRILQGSGEVTFTENGTFDSDGVAFVRDFTGTFTRSIGDQRVYTSNGTWSGKGTLIASWVGQDTVASCLDNSTAPMPENETLCLQDADEMMYLLDGVIEANGRLTSDGVSTLVTEHEGDSFEASGSYAGTGTFNGTGLFVGVGSFSGPMVQPGSFYITGLTPGIYHMIAQLENGKEVLLPDPVNVGVEPTYDLAMTMPGSIFQDTLDDFFEIPFVGQKIELVDIALGTEQSMFETTDEEGNFSFGPLASGEYFYRVDIDGDGWYELNQTLIVRDTSENFSLLMSVPEMHDVTLQLASPVDPLTQEPYANISMRTVTFTNDDPTFPAIDAVSNETGGVEIELPMGDYTISDQTAEDYILFDSFSLAQEDLSMTSSYAIATWVNGTIRVMNSGLDETYSQWSEKSEDLKLMESVPVPSLTIDFTSSELHFPATTDSNGNYSIQLPSGNTFHMSAFSTTSQWVTGQVIVLEGLPEFDSGLQYLEPSVSTNGFVYLYDNESLWEGIVPGFDAQTVVATNSDGLELRTTITDSGMFMFSLQEGAWDFTVEDAVLNSTTVEDYNILVETDGMPTPVELFVNPAFTDVTLNVFMDSGDDGAFENGTKVSPAFSLVPLNTHGSQVNVTADDYTSDGILTLTLEPGIYNIVFNATTATDENATDSPLITTSAQDPILIGLETYDEPIAVPMRNEYLVTGVLTNNSGDGIAKQFLLRNDVADEWFNIESDENGSFSAYVSAGDWIAIVAPFIADNESTETLRYSLTVGADSSLRTGVPLRTVDVVTVEFQLQEYGTEANMSSIRVTAVSHDGLGNVTLAKSDTSGNITDQLMPGNWSLFLNESNPQKQWSLDTSGSPFTTDDADNGTLVLPLQTAELEVEIGGKVFWDLDADDIPDGTEGIANTTVQVIGMNNTEFESIVTTDEYGVWTLFVPIQDEYQVSVSKEGFATEVYNISNSSAYPVYSEPVSHDLEMMAGNVPVSGNVTDINDAMRLDGASVVLYPSSGMSGEAISVDSTFENDQLSWSAVISPGEWIVVVTQANPSVNGGGVAVGLLDASISEGAILDLEMSLGGWVDLTTVWTSEYPVAQHHAGSASDGASYLNETVSVTFGIGEGIEWDMPVDADGEISILLPSQEVTMDSSFTTLQHDLLLEMDYIGGSVANIAEGRIAVNLSYSRSINSDTSLSMVSDTVVNATLVNGSMLDFMAVESGESYDAVEFSVDIKYDGTEVSDLFTMSGQVLSSPDEADWSVEFWNGTGFESSQDVTLGIGNNSADDSVQDSMVLRVRVLVANQSEVWHLEEAHKLKLILNSDGVASSELAFTVQVPKQHGLEISDVESEVGIADGGSNTFGFTLTNTGNGDDTFSITLADNIPDGWEVTPPISNVTIPKDGVRSQLFTAYAAENFTGTPTLTVTVTSEDGVTSESFDVEFTKSDIRLSVDQSQIILLSDKRDGEAGDLVIPVYNDGYLSTSNLVVSASIQGTDIDLGSQTVSIGAKSTEQVVFAISAEDASATVRYEVKVEVVGEESDYVTQQIGEDGEKVIDFSIKYEVFVESDDSPLLTFGILLLGFLVVYGGVKLARNGRNTTRF